MLCPGKVSFLGSESPAWKWAGSGCTLRAIVLLTIFQHMVDNGLLWIRHFTNWKLGKQWAFLSVWSYNYFSCGTSSSFVKLWPPCKELLIRLPVPTCPVLWSQRGCTVMTKQVAQAGPKYSAPKTASAKQMAQISLNSWLWHKNGWCKFESKSRCQNRWHSWFGFQLRLQGGACSHAACANFTTAKADGADLAQIQMMVSRWLHGASWCQNAWLKQVWTLSAKRTFNHATLMQPPEVSTKMTLIQPWGPACS